MIGEAQVVLIERWSLFWDDLYSETILNWCVIFGHPIGSILNPLAGNFSEDTRKKGKGTKTGAAHDWWNFYMSQCDWLKGSHMTNLVWLPNETDYSLCEFVAPNTPYKQSQFWGGLITQVVPLYLSLIVFSLCGVIIGQWFVICWSGAGCWSIGFYTTWQIVTVPCYVTVIYTCILHMESEKILYTLSPNFVLECNNYAVIVWIWDGVKL